MKKLVWAKTLFESYKYINRLIKSIDRFVFEKSVHSYNFSVSEPTTLEKMEAVIDLIQRKKRLLTIKMLVEESIKNIDREDAKILVMFYFDKIDVCRLLEKTGLNKRTLYRHMNKSLLECMDKIKDLGYGVLDLDLLLDNEGWIVGVYNGYAKKFGIEGKKLISKKSAKEDKESKVLCAYQLSHSIT